MSGSIDYWLGVRRFRPKNAPVAAQVLTRLEEHTLANHNKNPQTARFSEAVTLLSGVSGGAVGNVFFRIGLSERFNPPGCIGSSLISSLDQTRPVPRP